MISFGRYNLIRRVGSGGMAEIWKGRVEGPAGFEKTVAIKRILPNFEEDAEFVSMFISEARLSARLVHPNIVQVHDFGMAEDAGQPVHFIAMEYVAGQNVSTLQRRLSVKRAKVPLGIALFICAEAAKALSYAHGETDSTGKPLGFVHRDISPHNLMVSYHGDVKVADFGIAKAATAIRQTAAGVFKGKVTYMSPEQSRGEPLDGRSDLFSLGIVLYELVTGTRLFGGAIEEVFAQIRAFEPPDATRMAGVPEDVQRIVRTALAVDREERYQEAVELENDLNRAVAAGGWVGARSDLASLMQAQFAKEIEQDKRDAAPAVPRPQTAVLTNPFGEVASNSGTPTPTRPSPAAAAGGAGELGVSDAGPMGSPVAPTVSRPIEAPRVDQTRSELSIKQSGVKVLEASDTRVSRRRGGLLLAGAIALGAMLPVGGWLLVRLAAPAAGPAATPTPVVAVTPIETPPATAVEAPTATPEAPKPTPRRTPKREPTRRVVVTPVPERTATPRVAAATKTGWVTVIGRPWVQVWVDGKFVAAETPLKRHELSAGPHTFKFANPVASFTKTYRLTVVADREIELTVDTTSGRITAH